MEATLRHVFVWNCQGPRRRDGAGPTRGRPRAAPRHRGFARLLLLLLQLLLLSVESRDAATGQGKELTHNATGSTAPPDPRRRRCPDERIPWPSQSDTARVVGLDRVTTSIAAEPGLAVPLRLVVIHNNNRGGGRVGAEAIANQIVVLNEAFGGAQSAEAASTKLSFHLEQLVYVNTADSKYWNCNFEDDSAMASMYAEHVVEPARYLNIIICDTRTPYLGWVAAHPGTAPESSVTNAVVISFNTLPGGAYAGYNLGQTMTHEVGHFFGLYHTFQGGCTAPGDFVDDTPYEAAPSFTCDTEADTCPSKAGKDPVTNYMNYSPDTCFDRFTAGQARRMWDQMNLHRPQARQNWLVTTTSTSSASVSTTTTASTSSITTVTTTWSTGTSLTTATTTSTSSASVSTTTTAPTSSITTVTTTSGTGTTATATTVAATSVSPPVSASTLEPEPEPDTFEPTSAPSAAPTAAPSPEPSGGSATPGPSTTNAPTACHPDDAVATYLGVPLDSAAAQFGPQLLQPQADRRAVLAVPRDGCSPLENQTDSNIGAASGAIVIVERGGCSFASKVRHAAAAGASFVLVVNTPDGGEVTSMVCQQGCDGIALGSLFVRRGSSASEMIEAALAGALPAGDVSVTCRSATTTTSRTRTSTMTQPGPCDATDATVFFEAPLSDDVSRLFSPRPEAPLIVSTNPAIFGPTHFMPLVSSPVAVADPLDGCMPLSTSVAAGTIILIERGGCSFAIKVAHGEAAGAAFAVVVDRTGGSPLDRMACTPGEAAVCSGIGIPSAFVKRDAVGTMLLEGAQQGAFLGSGINVACAPPRVQCAQCQRRLRGNRFHALPRFFRP